MVIAALICFVVLLIAWILAPDEDAATERVVPRIDAEALATA